MADILVDGTTRVAFVTTISNTAAPTTAELNAGVLLTDILTKTGLKGFAADTAEVDNSSLGSKFGTKTIGIDSYKNTALELKRQSPIASDTAYNTLTRGTAGYIVVRRWVDKATAWTSGDKLEIYPVICGTRSFPDPESNTVAKYTVPVPITTDPVLPATVA